MKVWNNGVPDFGTDPTTNVGGTSYWNEGAPFLHIYEFSTADVIKKVSNQTWNTIKKIGGIILANIKKIGGVTT